MKWSQFFTSPVGRKIVMAFTGISLILFLAVHAGLNSCIFYDLPLFDANDNGSMFNRAAHFMGSSLVIRIMEIGLFAGFIIHIVQGYVIETKNLSRRGATKYAISPGSRSGSTWYSRSMAILGTLIFLFLIMHISHFWVPSRITHTLEPANYRGVEVHDLYLKMFNTFQSGWIVVLYLLGVLSLTFHLFHGFHSSFRSMGVHNKKYLSMLKGLGYGFTVIVCTLFALMPISMYFGWVSPLN